MQDELVRLEIAAGSPPSYAVDRFTSSSRHHFGGLPVVLAPVDETHLCFLRLGPALEPLRAAVPVLANSPQARGQVRPSSS